MRNLDLIVVQVAAPPYSCRVYEQGPKGVWVPISSWPNPQTTMGDAYNTITRAYFDEPEEEYMRAIRQQAALQRREEIEAFVHELGMDVGGHLDPSVEAICDLLAMLDGRYVPGRRR